MEWFNFNPLELSRHFPGMPISSGSFQKIKKFDPEFDERKYFSFCMFFSLFSAFIVLVVSLVLIPTISFQAFFVSFVFMLLFLFYYPLMRLKKITSIIEADLPLAIRSIALLLDMKLDFMRAVKTVSKESGAFSKELRYAVRENEHGIPFPHALANFSERFDSISLKRALVQLGLVYETGGGAKELRRMSEELLNLEKHKLKNFASKSAVFGLLFIVLSAILPTFFIIFAVMGKAVFETDISSGMLQFILLVVFPFMTFLLLKFFAYSLPPHPFSQLEKTDNTHVALFATIIIAFLPLPWRGIGLGVLMVAGIILFYKEYGKRKKIEEIDNFLPDALFSASGLPQGSKIDRVMESIAKAKHRSLSGEFLLSLRQLTANINPEAVLEDLAKRNKSMMLERACKGLLYAINTNTLDRLSDLADDLLSFASIKRERESLLAIQKYTLLLSAVLVPAIIKIALSLVSSISRFFPDVSSSLAVTVSDAVLPYLLIYSLISARYISDTEGKSSNMFFYFTIMVAASLGIFYIVNL